VRPAPPRLSVWLLRRVLPPGDAGAAVLGDLLEELDASGNTRAARRRFVRHACSVAVRYAVRRAPQPRPAETAHGESMAFDALRQDLRFAVRGIVKRPSFAAMVLATLALGIGASTAIFSITNAILLRPLPYVHADRLVYVSETNKGVRASFGYPNYVDYRDRAQSFDGLACHSGTSFTVLGESPQRVDGRLVCWNFFNILGVQPQLGRLFTSADDQPGAPAVALISERLWRQQFGGDPSIIGRTLRTNEQNLTIVGVLPGNFRFSRVEDVFAPLALTITPNSGWLDRGNHFGLYAIGRLKPGVTVQQAQAEADHVFADLKRAYPNTNSTNGGRVVLLRDRIVETIRDTLIALMAAVGFLLLLACVNVANLLVARGAARQHELAVRTALGGTRWRLVRQLLVESTCLSAAGAALGVLVAFWLLQLLIALAPPDVPRIHEVSLDRMSLAFAVAAAALCGLVFGSFPAFQASSGGRLHLLARASRTSSVTPHRTRRALMTVEVALALVLLAGCGLMARTIAGLHAVNPGFRSDHLLTARFSLGGPAWTTEKRLAFFDALLPKLNALPGVTRAALTYSLPIEGSQWGSIFTVSDKPVPPRDQLPAAAFCPIAANYFDTMGIRTLRGRTFDSRDLDASPKVILVNSTLARRIWPGEDAIGKRLKQGWPEGDGPWREVVGIVADVKLEGVDRDVPMQVFMPIAQETPRSVAIVARTSVEPMQVVRDIEAAVQSLNHDVPLTNVQPMTALMSDAIARQRLSLIVLAVFAVVAVLVAAVGLYGVVAHSVTERTREIGVRMALGAEGRQVLGLFVRQGLVTAAAGTVIGLGGAAAVTRVLEKLLFGVKPSDPATLGSVAALILVVAAIACYIPARRAARIDPLLALRAE
jgi:putative ABC transport system permease protein